jgi:hypothetical protein
MKCKKCEYDNPDEAAFCGLCYEVLRPAPQVPKRVVVQSSQFDEDGDDFEIFVGELSPSLSMFLSALIDLFRSRPSVQAAYWAHIGSRKGSDLPHPIVGVSVSWDINSIIQEAGWVATRTIPQKTRIDFLPMGADHFSQFMLMNTKPFYVKNKP